MWRMTTWQNGNFGEKVSAHTGNIFHFLKTHNSNASSSRCRKRKSSKNNNEDKEHELLTVKCQVSVSLQSGFWFWCPISHTGSHQDVSHLYSYFKPGGNTSHQITRRNLAHSSAHSTTESEQNFVIMTKEINNNKQTNQLMVQVCRSDKQQQQQ